MTATGTGDRSGPEDPAALLAEFRATLPRDARKAARVAYRVILAGRARRDDELELRGYWLWASAATSARRYRAARAVVREALRCAAAQRDEGLRARTLLGRGSALIYFGDLEQVRHDARTALPALQRAGDWRGQIAVHGLLANACMESGHPAEALRHLADQREVIRAHDAPMFDAVNTQDEALCRVALFQFTEAMDLFTRATAQFEAIGAPFEAAHSRYNTGYLHLKSGRYAEALRTYDQVAEVFAEERNSLLLRTLAVDRCELFLEIGAYPEARRWATSAAGGAGSLSAKDTLRTRQLLAVAALHDGSPGDARNAAASVALDFERFADPRGAAESLVVASAAALRLGRTHEARACAEAAAHRFERAQAGALACAADFALCRAAVSDGDLDAADAALARASARAGADTLPWIQVERDRHVAMTRRARKDVAGAARVLDRAVRHLDARRALLPPDALRSAFFSRHTALYREAVDAHLDQGDVDRAFELAAASKSRALLDMMAAGRLIDDEDAGAMDRLRTGLSAAYTRLQDMSGRRTPPAELTAARAEVDRLEREYSEASARALNRHPDRAPARPPQSSAEIRGALAPGDVLVEYVRGRGVLHAFVVTPTEVRHVGLRIDARRLATCSQMLAFQLMSAAQDPEHAAEDAAPGGPVRANLTTLRTLLVDPLDLPPDARRLIFAPEGELHAVPFHALPVGDGWLGERALVLYAPSAIVHAVCARDEPRPRGAPHVFAVPSEDLPQIREEARLVGAALGPGAVVHIGQAATWAALAEAARSASLLHIASHGFSRLESPVGGSLRLADSWLTQFDLYRLRVRAELVVLSACDSGVSRIEASGDPFGLVRGFLCAGARRLVASRWRVDDRVTAEWMAAFYGAMAADATVGDAYLTACKQVRESRPHPFHWAPFVLLGDASRTH